VGNLHTRSPQATQRPRDVRAVTIMRPRADSDIPPSRYTRKSSASVFRPGNTGVSHSCYLLRMLGEIFGAPCTNAELKQSSRLQSIRIILVLNRVQRSTNSLSLTRYSMLDDGSFIAYFSRHSLKLPHDRTPHQAHARRREKTDRWRRRLHKPLEVRVCRITLGLNVVGSLL
jgi:hypothetical protein